MKIKKITALILVLVLSASIFAGCSKNYQTVVTIDGVTIAPNVYLYAQLQAYLDATNKVESEQNILKATIDELPAVDWIHQETIAALKKDVLIDKLFKERSLSITQEETANINAQSEYYWSLLSEMYTKNGIGMQTYQSMMLNSTKSNKIFMDIYGEGGEKEPTNQEVGTYLEDSYIRTKGFYLAKKADSAQEIVEENVIKLADIAKQAMDALNSGENFDETLVKYMSIAGTVVGSDTDYTDAVTNTTTMFVAKDSETFPEEFLTEALKLDKNGKYAMAELDDKFFVYQVIDTYKDDEELKTLKSSVISEMKNDEFTDYISKESEKLEIVQDAAAVKYYSVSKIDMTD